MTPQEYDFNKYTPEVQRYILQQMDDSMYPMRKNEIYVNSTGKEYLVLEDSPAGEVYVKVRTNCFSGTAERWVAKTVIVS